MMIKMDDQASEWVVPLRSSSQDEEARTTDHYLWEQSEEKDRSDDLPECSSPRDDEDDTPAPRNLENSEETRLPFFEQCYLNFDFHFDFYLKQFLPQCTRGFFCFIHLFIHLFIHSSIYPFIHLFIHSFIKLPICTKRDYLLLLLNSSWTSN